MAYSSIDDYVNKTSTLRKVRRPRVNKLSHPAAAVAGEFSSLFVTAGYPALNPMTAGTNRSLQTLNSKSLGAIECPHMIAEETMTLLEGAMVSAAPTTMPAVLHLVDMLAYYPVNNLTLIGSQPMINASVMTADATTDIVTHATYDIASISRCRVTTTGTLPGGLVAGDMWTVRQSATTSKLALTYRDAIAGVTIDITTIGAGTHTITILIPRSIDGAGVDAFCVATSALGAGTPTLQLATTNQLGAAGRLTPSPLPINKTAAALGLLTHSGVGAGKYGPYLPLQPGDFGIRSIDVVNQSATQTSGSVAYVLCREIATLPLSAIGVTGEREFLSAVPGLPVIDEGACLAWLLFNGANTPANSGFVGHIGIGWG